MKHNRTDDKWRDIFDQQRSSGLNIQTFCQQHKIATSNFYKHRKMMDKTRLPEFVKVNINPSNTSKEAWALLIILKT